MSGTFLYLDTVYIYESLRIPDFYLRTCRASEACLFFADVCPRSKKNEKKLSIKEVVTW